MKYIQPNSVTWWAGVMLLALGLVLGVDDGYDLGRLGVMVRSWTGGMGAGALIFQGLGLIGIRAALKPER